MSTPMRQQYLSLKRQHEDCILLFRLGDFYETFDEDAKTVARVCDVVLTSRPVGGDKRVPLAGVPYHSVDGYIEKLIRAGYRVAIAEQVSEPGRGLVEREVHRVVTQGTVVEPGMLDEKRNNYLAAVSINSKGDKAGLAYCDISTGEFAVTSINAREPAVVESRLGEELSRLRPSELIHIDWDPAESALHGLVNSLGMLLSTVEAWQVDADTARELLERHFQVATLDGFGVQNQVQAIRAAAGILAYLREMQPAAVVQLRNLHSYTVGEYMTLDESTRRNLELTETIRSGGSKGSLLDVLDSTRTPMGGRLLRRWLSQPLLDVDAINQRLDAVEHFVQDTELRTTVREQLKQIGDLERWTNRVSQGIALPRDLVGMRDVVTKVQALQESIARIVRDHSAGQSTVAMPRLPSCDDVLSLLESAIADEPSATLANAGIIRDGYSSELDELTGRSRDAKDLDRRTAGQRATASGH